MEQPIIQPIPKEVLKSELTPDKQLRVVLARRSILTSSISARTATSNSSSGILTKRRLLAVIAIWQERIGNTTIKDSPY